MLTSGTIANLIQGVSQQPDALRLPTQLELQENCYSSEVEGLIRRPPTEHIARVSATPLEDASMHTINRDSTKRYKAILTDLLIKVFDLEGVEKTVLEVGSAYDYLACTTPREELRCLTVADFTFVVNTTVVPAMDATLSPVRDDEAMIFVKAGEYGSNYKVYINGVEVASHTTSTTDVLTLATDAIALELYNDLVAWAGAGFTFALRGSVIHVVHATTDFTIRTEDSQGGQSLLGFKDKTGRFSELPASAPNGFVLAIDANPDTQAGAYYVKAEVNQASETFGPCTWRETVQPGLTYAIDPTTMPHALIRQADGSFTFEALEWGDREAGDEDSNGVPSFIGSPINDIFFYKNRLGLLADEYYLMSETDDYFNFWRKTVTAALDTDPIDIKPAHTKVSILKRVVPFSTDLIVFSDQTQFKVPGSVAMTPRTVRCDPASEFECNLLAAPINAGKSVYFVFNRGAEADSGYAGMKELSISEADVEKFDDEDVTANVPSYVPAGVFRLVNSTVEGVCGLITTGEPNAMYLYKTAWSGRKKAQGAWFKWTLGPDEDTKILDAAFIETTMYLLVQRNDEVFLEKMLLMPSRVDTGSTYVTLLDRRFDEDAFTVPPAYDAATNQTTFTGFPYTPTASAVLVTKTGIKPVVLSQDTTSLVVRGDYSATSVWMGERFTSRARPSTLYKRKPSQSGNLIIDSTGKLQLLRGYLSYDDSGYFKVSVTPEGRSTSDYIFTGRVVGDINNVIGSVALRGGVLRFAILSLNTRVTIEVSSDSFVPFKLTSLDWEGEFTKRSQG